jgi:hypothetical protein
MRNPAAVIVSLVVVAGGCSGHQKLSAPPIAGASDCPYSGALHSVTGEAIPHEGETSLAHVQEVVASLGAEVRSHFASVVNLTVAPRNGEVWRGTRGDFSIHRVHDYWIAVHLQGRTFCPSQEAASRSFDGVPLHFVVG